MRCPDCNKFVSNEQADPEVNDVNVTHEVTDAEPGDATVSGSVRLVLACADCSSELAEANPDFEVTVSLKHVQAAEPMEHSLSVENEAAESTDRYDGKPGTPSRYRRHYYGATVTGQVVCSCGIAADFEVVAEEQAGGFDPLN